MLKLPKGMDTDLLYYQAGPMTGYPDYNYPYFTTCAHKLRVSGVLVSSPHENPWPDDSAIMPGEELWQYMMRAALKQLLDCQGIILLKGWTASRGAVIEAGIASALQMPAYFLDGDILVAMHREKA